MKLGIIGWDYEEFETLNLVEVAKNLGHEVYLFTLQDVRIQINTEKITILTSNNESINDLDVCISRAQVRPNRWQQDFEVYEAICKVVPVVDAAPPFLLAESKLLTMQKLKEAGLPVPDTFQCRTLEQIKEIWGEYGKIVVKPSYGFAGCDVERVTDHFPEELLNRLLNKYESLLVQEYIPHPDGDIRNTVVGEEIVFSIRRIPNEKTWKANIALGADFTSYEPSDYVKDLSIKAAKVINISIAGLDILQSGDKYYIIEVNNVPGWYPLPKEERERVCTKIIELTLKQARVKQSR
ncbi:ATP-grasp domain-containing protein [Caldibacillus thermoamylovorans]